MREEEKVGREVMIRSDPNYVGEIEPRYGGGRGEASPRDTVNQDMSITEILR